MIQLNYRDVRPIYEQVRDGLRQLVLSGAILPNEKLPSVRSLASSLAINPNTISRAYEALEKEGYVYTQVGKGTFAAELSDVKDERVDTLTQQWQTITMELLRLGTSAALLLDKIKEMEEDGRD